MNQFDSTYTTIMESLDQSIDEGFLGFKSKAEKEAEVNVKKQMNILDNQLERLMRVHDTIKNDKSELILSIIDKRLSMEKDKRDIKNAKINLIKNLETAHNKKIINKFETFTAASKSGQNYGIDYVATRGKVIERKS